MRAIWAAGFYLILPPFSHIGIVVFSPVPDTKQKVEKIIEINKNK
ncbi:hypothetical protein JOD45_000010 [Scopulibacillus daqui]|uniref:YvrJ-like protein n=1 Tax=Scopulibacillus daqui TaxID=1469162 RepID=A0ABS2PWH3_9BACL|nr:hypothetical protein [Scopulibacillus daqui]